MANHQVDDGLDYVTVPPERMRAYDAFMRDDINRAIVRTQAIPPMYTLNGQAHYLPP
jgi:hypothetical protein